MAQTFKVLDEEPTPTLHEPEIRVPSAGTWLALGAAVLVVMAGFIWTIL